MYAHRTASARRIANRYLEREAARNRLRKSTIEALLKAGRQFGVLSAYGPGSKSENQRRHGELIAELQRRGYRKWSTVKGSWEGVAEKSVFVPNMKSKDVFDLGRMFDQDSTIYKGADGVIGMYYTHKGVAEVAVDPQGDAAAAIKADKTLYSKGRGISFEFDFLWGQHVPWNGRTPVTAAEVGKLLAEGKLEAA